MQFFAQTLGQNLPHVKADSTTLGNVLNVIYALAGALAVIFIIISGIRYTLSAGDASKVAQAKSGIFAAIVGLVIVVFAYAITNFVIGALAAPDFNTLRQNIVNTLGFAGGILAVIMIIYGAFRYVTSNGDASKIKSAKDTILYAVIGLVIVIAAYAIVNFVLGALS